jgi:CSLREA domain-containing protein
MRHKSDITIGRLVVGIGMLLGVGAALAQTFVVNDAGDAINPSCGTVGGTCSLRDAITKSQGIHGWSIQFAIGNGQQTITIQSNLPDIITRGTLDGTTQPGYAGVPLIEIHRDPTGSADYGLHVGSPPLVTDGLVAIKAVVISHFDGTCANCGGIILDNPGSNFIQGCYIGTDATGMAADGNTVGILDNTLGGNTFGGALAADRNVISGNSNGLVITAAQGGYSVQDVIAGNYIGTNALGTAAVPNIGVGIAAGPPYPGFTPGIVIGGPPGSGNGNVIAGSYQGGGIGIQLTGGGGNLVQGNTIGLDATGLVSLPIEHGVVLIEETNAVVSDNVIAVTGNAVTLTYALSVTYPTIGATVQGNLLGTDSTGNRLVSAGATGVYIDGAQNSAIGGAAAGQGNVIGGFQYGIYVGPLTSTGNFIIGNSIGLGADGQSAIPNVLAGVVLNANDNVVGGDGVGQENYIAFTGQGTFPRVIAPGVWVQNGHGNPIRGNAIFLNTGKGIDFYSPPNALPYPNHIGANPAGPNDYQNFPLITSTTFTPSSIRVQGTLNSLPNTLYSLDFYANFVPLHPADFIQGKAYLGLFEPTTDAQGNATFDVTFTLPTVPNLVVTATASDPGGIPGANTSEFAQRSLFSVTPNFGPAAGGTLTTLTGQLFQAGAVVRFGNAISTTTTFLDATTMSAVAPALPPGSLVDVSVTNPDGTTALMQKAFVTDFLDVAPGSPSYDYIKAVASDGVTLGCGGGNFCPNANVTRAQMALFLLRAKYGPWWVPPPATGIFADVPVGSQAAAWIEELYNEGITQGCSAMPRLYCPNDPVTRTQMAPFLLRSQRGASYTPPPCTGIFADVACMPVKAPFVDWIEELFAEGITLGCSPSPRLYCPSADVFRAQMAIFLVRTFNLPFP